MIFSRGIELKMVSQEEKASINCKPGWFPSINSLFTRRVSWLVIILLAVSTHRANAQSEFDERWSMKRLVEFHQSRHADLRVQDVYKLLYQSCFGVEHILSDSSEVVAYLMNELRSVDSSSSSEPLLERISSENDHVRVNLRPFKTLNLDPLRLVKAMFQSARETIPDTMMFYRMWNEFSALVRFGLLNLPLSEVKAWDEKVERGLREVVHHSSEYAAANRPAYRVVKRAVFEVEFGRNR